MQKGSMIIEEDDMRNLKEINLVPLPSPFNIRKEKRTYTYDLRTTLAVRGAGGYLTTKKGAWCGAVLVRCGAFFVDIFHFLLLFVTFFIARKFYKLFFTAETGVKFVIFCYFFYCL